MRAEADDDQHLQQITRGAATAPADEATPRAEPTAAPK
jgi:hypothetical protein